MEFAFIELILWIGFGLLIWALHDQLKQAEVEIDQQRTTPPRAARRPYFCTPQNLIEPIGSYLDKQIYRYAVIDGKYYLFDHVCPRALAKPLQSNQRFIAPGLVYTQCILTLADA